MSRYIKADVLINAISEHSYNLIDCGNNVGVGMFIDGIRQAIDEAPSIDIVRCKECKHRPVKEDANGEDYGFNIIAPERSSICPCIVDDGWYSWMPKDNFFCGYGERESE